MSKADNSKVVSRKPFDLQESVVLLDVYLSLVQKGMTNTEAANIASNRLRELAHRRGMIIDTAFRSSMGIQNRLRSIRGVYEGRVSPSAPETQIFREAIELYKNDPDKFRRILRETTVEGKRSLKSRKSQKSSIQKTKFVKSRKDSNLKALYGESFKSVYYALKGMCKRNAGGVTATDVFLALEREMKRKDISVILHGASWSKKISDTRYMFFDKDQEERKQKQVEDTLRIAEQEFFAWLPCVMPPSALNEVKSSYRTISTMLMHKKALPQSLIATTQIGQVENAIRQSKIIFGNKKLRNNAQKLLSAYLAYIREKKNTIATESDVPDVDVQENWIRFDFMNSIQFERTVPAYCSISGQRIEDKNWARILVGIVEKELAKNNPALEILYKQSLLPNRKDRPFFLKQKLEGLNCSELSNGYWLNVNYSIPRLMDQIQAICLQCGYNKGDVIIYGILKNDNKKNNSFPTTSKNSNLGSVNSMDIEKAEVYLMNTGLKGATVQDLIDNVQPGTAVYPTQKLLDTCENVIAMPGNRYVHVNAFVDLDEAKEEMLRILRTHFSQFGGYSNNKLLFGAASHDLSMFLNDNDCEDIDVVYALARFFFENKNFDGGFKFSYPHIFEKEPDYPMTLKGLMINLARINGGVLNAEEAKTYLQKTMLSYGSVGQLLQISSSDTFLFYDENRYFLTERIGIDATWIQIVHDRMDNLFRQANVAYVIPRNITDSFLYMLPTLPQNLPWTTLLLQEVLRNFPSVGFRPITSELGQSYDTIAAAFVPINSPLQTFPDVVTLYMQDRHMLPKRMTGEELRQELREAGMLEGNELVYALPKALNDYRFSWTDENKMVLVRGN